MQRTVFGSLLLKVSQLTVPHEFPRRSRLPHILNAQGLLGRGAELGVRQGHFSEVLLRHWRGERLYLVDPWRDFTTDATYRDGANVSQREHDENLAITLERLERYEGRFEVVRETSTDAAELFEDASLDFVYIDAMHHYEAIRDDFERWYPKVRPGGVVAGHDYLDIDDAERDFAVKRAVDEQCEKIGVTPLVTREKWPSWMIYKPE